MLETAGKIPMVMAKIQTIFRKVQQLHGTQL